VVDPTEKKKQRNNRVREGSEGKKTTNKRKTGEVDLLPDMSVTVAVYHFEMSALKYVLSWNKLLMSFTFVITQFPIGPFGSQYPHVPHIVPQETEVDPINVTQLPLLDSSKH
jgi:hypothetical protein